MLRLEVVNELTLKVESDGYGQDVLFTKTGAFFGRDEGLSYSDGAKTQ